jgi:menaquinone-dependent protoporphyrinogen oxidase
LTAVILPSERVDKEIIMTHILVTYASKHNATAEIACAIGEVIRQIDGSLVDVASVENVHDITPYDAVILGSAVYAGQWQKQAVDFLKQHETELAQRPVWLFSSGPVGEGDAKDLLNGWTFPEALQPVAERINPHDIILFHGSIDPLKLNFVERVVVKGIQAPTGDFRDWDVIRGWAYNIAQDLRGA